MCAYQQLNVAIKVKRRIEELKKLCKTENKEGKLYYYWGEIDAYKESLTLRFNQCIRKIDDEGIGDAHCVP